MQDYKYNIFGLVVRSVIKLPLKLIISKKPSDVIITIGSLPPKPNQSPFFKMIEDRFGLGFIEVYQTKGIFETYLQTFTEDSFYVRDGKIVVFNIGNATTLSIRQLTLFLYHIIPTILHHRKCFLLHGSAIAFNGRGYIFMGNSGVGKSTTVSSIINTRYKFLTDDICLIKYHDEKPYIHTSSPFMKLTDTIFEQLTLFEDYFKPYTRLDKEKKQLCKIQQTCLQQKPVPLENIVEIVVDDQSSQKFERVNGFKKIEILTRNPARPLGLQIYQLKPQFYKNCFFLSSKVTISKINRRSNEFIAPTLKCKIAKIAL